MFRRKKKEIEIAPVPAPEVAPAEVASEALPAAEISTSPTDSEAPAAVAAESGAPDETAEASAATKSSSRVRGNRVQKIGTVSSDKMLKTVVVRVDRLVLHQKYRRYVRRTSKFMAHDDLGATTGDRVRIVETRPLSAHKRWRVVEIVRKAAK
jgi:small subunit ribosomal protein S17